MSMEALRSPQQLAVCGRRWGGASAKPRAPLFVAGGAVGEHGGIAFTPAACCLRRALEGGSAEARAPMFAAGGGEQC